MRLPPGPSAEVEQFLAAFVGEPGLRLPCLLLHAPRPARLLESFGVVAITLGRHVVLSPRVVEWRDAGPRVPASLLVHECLHVLQYRAGLASFLARYLLAWTRGLRVHGLSRRARTDAYRDIPFEQEARRAESAWAAQPGRPSWFELER